MQCVKHHNEKWLRSIIEKWDESPRGKIFQLIKIESSKTEKDSTHHLFLRSINWGTYRKITLIENKYNFDIYPVESISNPDLLL